MKKILSGVFVATFTLVVPGAAFAQDQPLPGRRPPCSIIRETPFQAVHSSLCTNPAPGGEGDG